jgi:hypothetical protein
MIDEYMAAQVVEVEGYLTSVKPLMAYSSRIGRFVISTRHDLNGRVRISSAISFNNVGGADNLSL